MKPIVKTLLVLASLIVVVVVAGYFLDAIVKAGVEAVGPKLTGATVSVDDIDLRRNEPGGLLPLDRALDGGGDMRGGQLVAFEQLVRFA